MHKTKYETITYKPEFFIVRDPIRDRIRMRMKYSESATKKMILDFLKVISSLSTHCEGTKNNFQLISYSRYHRLPNYVCKEKCFYLKWKLCNEIWILGIRVEIHPKIWCSDRNQWQGTLVHIFFHRIFRSSQFFSLCLQTHWSRKLILHFIWYWLSDKWTWR